MGRITSSRKQLKPDPRFNSILASKFVNCLMWDGKKTTALAVFYDALDELNQQLLQRNITRNSFSNVQLFPCALSDHAGRADDLPHHRALLNAARMLVGKESGDVGLKRHAGDAGEEH